MWFFDLAVAIAIALLMTGVWMAWQSYPWTDESE